MFGVQIMRCEISLQLVTFAIISATCEVISPAKDPTERDFSLCTAAYTAHLSNLLHFHRWGDVRANEPSSAGSWKAAHNALLPYHMIHKMKAAVSSFLTSLYRYEKKKNYSTKKLAYHASMFAMQIISLPSSFQVTW